MLNPSRSQLVLGFSVAMTVAAGIFFVPGGPRLLTQQESGQVMGGTINGVQFVFANCPAATLCTAIPCQPNPQGAWVCGAFEMNQTMPNYPQGTQAGSAYETTVPWNYLCNQWKSCSNPCLQAAIAPFNHFCNVGVGNWQPMPLLQGAGPGVPFSPEA